MGKLTRKSSVSGEYYYEYRLGGPMLGESFAEQYFAADTYVVAGHRYTGELRDHIHTTAAHHGSAIGYPCLVLHYRQTEEGSQLAVYYFVSQQSLHEAELKPAMVLSCNDMSWFDRVAIYDLRICDSMEYGAELRKLLRRVRREKDSAGVELSPVEQWFRQARDNPRFPVQLREPANCVLNTDEAHEFVRAVSCSGPKISANS